MKNNKRCEKRKGQGEWEIKTPLHYIGTWPSGCMGLVAAQVLPQAGLHLCNRALQKSKVGREQRKHGSLLNDLKRNQRQRRKMARRNKGNREQINRAQDVTKEKSRSQKHGERCERNIELYWGNCWNPQHRWDRAAWKKTGALTPWKNSMFLLCLPCSQHQGTSPNSWKLCRKKGRKFFTQNAFGPWKIYSKYQGKILSCSWTVSRFFWDGGWRYCFDNKACWYRYKGSSWRSNTTLGNGATSLTDSQCCFWCLTLNNTWSLQDKRKTEL